MKTLLVRTTGIVARLRVASVFPLACCTVAMVAGMVGCSFEERIRSRGEYPVVNKDTFDGGACVSNGDEPSYRYVRYPANKVPVYLEDEYQPTWDDYLKYGDICQQAAARKHLQ